MATGDFTPRRAFRMNDDEYDELVAKVKDEGKTVSGVLRQLIREYMQPSRRLPVRLTKAQLDVTTADRLVLVDPATITAVYRADHDQFTFVHHGNHVLHVEETPTQIDRLLNP